jgi:hypothetical protein
MLMVGLTRVSATLLTSSFAYVYQELFGCADASDAPPLIPVMTFQIRRESFLLGGKMALDNLITL